MQWADSAYLNRRESTGAEGKSANTFQLDSDNISTPIIKSTGSEDVIDMTTNDLPSSSQPVSFDALDEELEADLIAAVDKSSANHASDGSHHTASAAREAPANTDPAAHNASGQQHHSAGSQAADIIHHHQEQQQQQQQTQQQSQVQETQSQQQQLRGSSRQSINASAGIDDSLPAPSEQGLGEYGSAALGGVPSMGVSSTLPSFDLDAEMDSLDKQTKVSHSCM